MSLADFHLLLLADDPKTLRDMTQAAERAGLGPQLQVVRSADEALSVLSSAEAGVPEGRSRPTVLLDLAGRDALQLLERLARKPALRPPVCIGLVPPDDGVLLGRAYRLGVNSCLVRPAERAGQDALFRSIRQYWQILNVVPGSWSFRRRPP